MARGGVGCRKEGGVAVRSGHPVRRSARRGGPAPGGGWEGEGKDTCRGDRVAGVQTAGAGSRAGPSFARGARIRHTGSVSSCCQPIGVRVTTWADS